MATTSARTAESVAEDADNADIPTVLPEEQRPRPGKPWWAWPLCFALYLFLTIVGFGPSTSLGAGRMVGRQGLLPDQIDLIWFLKWSEFAIAHGHSPFYTHWQNYPHGFNVLVDTSMIALGVLFSPVTAAFGPVVTWNLLSHLALSLSALSMCVVLRRWTKWWPAAFIGGLLYGFSAYTTVSIGDLHLYFVPIPPLILLLLHEIVFRQRWHPVKTGALLGVLCAVQYLISSEVLVSTMLVGATAAVLYLIACRKDMASKWPYIKRSLYSTAIVGGVLLAYPVGFTLFGPDAIQGSPQFPKNLAVFHGDLLSPVIPAIGYFRSPFRALSSYGGSMYLGPPLVAILIATVVWLRRRGIVVLAGSMIAFSLVLSMGATLYIDGHDTGVPLPFSVLGHLPLFDGLIPDRFALYSSLFAGGILAVGIDALYAGAYRSMRRAARWGPAIAASVILCLVAAALVPLIPRNRYPSIPTPTAPFFTSSAMGAIPPGSVVLAYPYPQSWHAVPASLQSVDDALLDQAVSGMRFPIIGGYGWRPRWGYGTAEPSVLKPLSVETLFNASFYGTATAAQFALLKRSNLVGDLRVFLRRHDVGTIIVLPLGEHPAFVTERVTAAIGAPLHSGGVTVWFHVQQRLAATT